MKVLDRSGRPWPALVRKFHDIGRDQIHGSFIHVALGFHPGVVMMPCRGGCGRILHPNNWHGHPTAIKLWWCQWCRRRRGRIKLDAQRNPNGWVGLLRKATGRDRPSCGLTRAQICARWEFYANRCAWCGEPAARTDHAQPWSQGGYDYPVNLRPACERCDLAKANKGLWVWLHLSWRKPKLWQPKPQGYLPG